MNRRGMDEALFTHQLHDGYAAERMYAGDDTLFEFYARLHTLLSHIRLDPFDIRHYGRSGENIGGYHVHGHMWATTDGAVWRYSDAFVLKVIVAWQAERRVQGRPATNADVLRYQLGTVPEDMSERFLSAPAFLFNSTQAPPTTDLVAQLRVEDDRAVNASPLFPSEQFYVGSVRMIVPWAAVREGEGDIELVEGLTPDDL